MMSFVQSLLLGCVMLVSATASGGDPPPWTYEGDRGPESWAKLTPDFAACAGKNQSPINLTGFIEAELCPIGISYENNINGKAYLMEAHLVHADKAGNLAVVALLFDEGEENKALAQIWPSIPGNAGEKNALPSLFSVEQLLPPSRDYYRFNGSLTTPPCTEGVRWLVMKETVFASRMQVDAFADAILHHPNNRPLQPVNARAVLQ